MTTYHDDRTPFMYAIGWTALDRWYVGVRYAKGCHPSDLWTTYFTSSRYVADFREQNGEPDHIEVLFSGSKESMVEAEDRHMRDWEMHRDERFLNKNVSGKHFYLDDASIEKLRVAMTGKTIPPEVRAKMSASKKGKPMSAATRANMKGRVFSDEHRAKLSAAHKGKAAWNKGKKLGPQTDEHKAAISEAVRTTLQKRPPQQSCRGPFHVD